MLKLPTFVPALTRRDIPRFEDLTFEQLEELQEACLYPWERAHMRSEELLIDEPVRATFFDTTNARMRHLVLAEAREEQRRKERVTPRGG